jgi:penicillin amidase
MIDGLEGRKPVAMSWIYTQQPLRILDAEVQLQSKADFKKVLP